MAGFEDFQHYRQYGWQTIPIPLKSKSPNYSWKQYQTERYPERDLRDAFQRAPEYNVFLITGAISGLVVLDNDNQKAIDYWCERLTPEVYYSTARTKSSLGEHLYWRLTKGRVERGRSSTDLEKTGKWDIRAEGQGVVAPPSIHPSGRRYEWVEGHGPETIKNAPKELWRQEGEGQFAGEDNVRSMLSSLLANPPAGKDSGRNNWLAAVAGHYAAAIRFKDAFDQMVKDANDKLEYPLQVGDDGPEDDEVLKLIESIWGAEQAKKGRAAPPPEEGEDPDTAWWRNLVLPLEENGYLVSGRTHIMCQTRERTEGKQYNYVLKPYMNADIHVLGVVGQGDMRSYEVELMSAEWRIQASLPSDTVADPRVLNRWLAGYGVSIGQPDDIWPVRIRDGARLLRYLEAQDAQNMEIVEALGWHDESESFVTHEGLIRADGPAEHESVRPSAALRNWAPHHYGFGGKQDAQRVLSEVLTFHDETVAAVFGAWWAATLLKPQIHKLSSQFPFMALEAPSESGKSIGMFSLLMKLSGYSGGSTATTRAALRDALSAHWSGIVWLDDLDTLENLMELLRQVTIGGSLIKKGSDHESQVVAPLRAALVVSGENLGLRGQKALLDRAVLLDVPSPTNRKSLRSGRSQWDDLVALKMLYPDLTVFAGSIIELALGQVDIVKELPDLRIGAGRHADKGAVLRVGARILSGILGGYDQGIIERVDKWVIDAGDPGQENSLTLRALPSALGKWGWPTFPQRPLPDRRRGATPAWLDPDHPNVIWFSPKLLAEWLRENSYKIQGRLESEEALIQQARALGLGGTSKQWRLKNEWGRVSDENNDKYYYWRIEGGLAEDIISRSRGDLE